MADPPIYCKRCGNKMILLLISSVCDTCDPPGGAGKQKTEINWWEYIWYNFIGNVQNASQSRLNKPLHSSQIGNLSNGRAAAVVLFWPQNDQTGVEKSATVYNTKDGSYLHFKLMNPAKDAGEMPGMPENHDKYIHDLTTATPYFGQYADKYSKMIILMEDMKKNPIP